MCLQAVSRDLNKGGQQHPSKCRITLPAGKSFFHKNIQVPSENASELPSCRCELESPFFTTHRSKNNRTPAITVTAMAGRVVKLESPNIRAKFSSARRNEPSRTNYLCHLQATRRFTFRRKRRCRAHQRRAEILIETCYSSTEEQQAFYFSRCHATTSRRRMIEADRLA